MRRQYVVRQPGAANWCLLDPLAVNRIPRGVLVDGRLAVVHDNQGVVVALHPSTGEVRWRHGRGLRPCSIAGEVVVAVSVSPPTSGSAPALGIVVLGEDDGRELWSAPAVELPDWARPALDDTPEFALSCTVFDGDQVVLRWQARAFYGGGAAAGPERVAAAAREARGAVRIDLRQRRVEQAPVDPLVVGSEDEQKRAPALAPELASDVIDYGEAGALRVELAVVPQGTSGAPVDAVVLRGIDVKAGDLRWEVALDEAPRRPPPKLRP